MADNDNGIEKLLAGLTNEQDFRSAVLKLINEHGAVKVIKTVLDYLDEQEKAAKRKYNDAASTHDEVRNLLEDRVPLKKKD